MTHYPTPSIALAPTSSMPAGIRGLLFSFGLAAIVLAGCALPEDGRDGPDVLSAQRDITVAEIFSGADWRLSTTSSPNVFEENIGQADSRVQFQLRRPRYNVFVTGDSLVTVLDSPKRTVLSGTNGPDGKTSSADSSKQFGTAIEMIFADRSAAASIVGRETLSTTANIYVGADSARWKTGVPLHAMLHHRALYPGVDLALISDRGRLSYNFVLRPDGDITSIKLKFRGLKAISVTDDGRLALTLPDGGQLFHSAPKFVEYVGGEQKKRSGKFRLLSDYRVGFQVDGRNPNATLVIDPTVDFASYFGGTGTDAFFVLAHRLNQMVMPAFDIDSDRTGNAVIAGTTFSPDLPLQPGPVPIRNTAAFAARLNPDASSGPRFDFVTYLDGTGGEIAYGVAGGPAGTTYVCGATGSADFPVEGTTFDTVPTIGPLSGFIAQLNDNGILRRTAFIDPGTPTSIYACEYEPPRFAGLRGKLHITGNTEVGENEVSPLATSGAAQTEGGGIYDAFVAKLAADLSGIDYFTLLGGIYEDSGFDIKVRNGVVFIAGMSESWNFPVTNNAHAEHTLDSTNGTICGELVQVPNCYDTFVARFSKNGQIIDYATFLGVPGIDIGRGLDIDSALNAHVALETVVSGVNSAASLVKIASDGSSLLYHHDLTTSINRAFDVAVDQRDYAHLVGDVGANNLARGNPISDQLGGSWDGFLATFDPNGNMFYFTYLGGEGFDGAYRVALTKNRCAYVLLESQSDSLNIPVGLAPQNARAGADDLLTLRHCDPGDIDALVLTKLADPTFVEPEETVRFRISIDNPGTWIGEGVKITDKILVPFKFSSFTGDNCVRSGQSLSCVRDWLPHGTTRIAEITAENQLSCIRELNMEERPNRVEYKFTNGQVRESVTPVFYRACDPEAGIEGAACNSAADCLPGLSCVRRCDLVEWCTVPLGPLCLGRYETAFTQLDAFCRRPEDIRPTPDRCDRILP